MTRFKIVLLVSIFLVQHTRCIAKSSRNIRSFFIAEGTVWCGPGNNAKNCFDFGNHTETDKCCQTHDCCPWTFSKHNNHYNGFKSGSYFTLSHCECDLRFYECLNEQPYKQGSNFILSTFFDAYQAKCFAYLPCDDSIFSLNDKRRTGACYKNLRVMEFDSIGDYNSFVRYNVKSELILALRELQLSATHLMTERKKNAPCNFKFANYSEELTDSLARRFYTSDEQQPSSPTPPMILQPIAIAQQNVDSDMMMETTSSSTTGATTSTEEVTMTSLPDTNRDSTPKRVYNLIKKFIKNMMKSSDEETTTISTNTVPNTA